MAGSAGTRVTSGSTTLRRTPARHKRHYRLVARNRVWVALRRLPVPLVPIYLAVWVILSVVRFRASGKLIVCSAASLKACAEGTGSGARCRGGRCGA